MTSASPAEAAPPYPTALVQLDPRTLGITWSDGHHSRHVVRDLRLTCACAMCVDEMTGERRLDPQYVPANVHPLRIDTVGHYALHIHWSDGHQSGYYRYEDLRAM